MNVTIDIRFFKFLQIFLGKIVSRIAPSYQVVGSENSSLLSRDPEQVRPSPEDYRLSI